MAPGLHIPSGSAHVPPFPPCLQGCSRLRELSICLIRLLLVSVFGRDRRRMRSKTWDLLLPLFFHMSDQSRSVAEASQEALLAAATLLEWEELRRLLETRQMWRVAGCLLERSRKRAQRYLHQSLRYLQDAQVPLQEAAVRFIGLAARPLRGKSPWKLQQICRGEEGAVAGGMLLATEGLIPLSLDHSSGSAAG
ncbi:maestro heat-like repeat family member 5 [Pezoporus flaviventris]|uniref:maestro heat-like repeat family member 5 n=1 Tax=Pezoporus flaviventris TaxID=889875 RepID=UPI002AB2FC57|nr:maestro heat-like repeat family member 5 [Pezoporus flaviventris]